MNSGPRPLAPAVNTRTDRSVRWFEGQVEHADLKVSLLVGRSDGSGVLEQGCPLPTRDRMDQQLQLVEQPAGQQRRTSVALPDIPKTSVCSLSSRMPAATSPAMTLRSSIPATRAWSTRRSASVSS
jgi:hypothetical protein